MAAPAQITTHARTSRKQSKVLQQSRTNTLPDIAGDINIGQSERMVSIASGAILALEGLAKRNGVGALIAGVGAALIYRGATGRSPIYQTLGINTADGSATRARRRKLGVHVTETFLINKSAEDLYARWRNLENLPTIMSHLLEVRKLDAGRSHWAVKAPAIAGGRVEWDAETIADEPNSRIAWRSLPDSDVDHSGEVRFARAPGDRGTILHIDIHYSPPAGRLGHWVAKLFGEAADQEIREDLRNFKRLMEIGEVPTVKGQPRGTCTRMARSHNN